MSQEFDNRIMHYLALAEKFALRQTLVGGGAVNFHGYKRHSAHVDFWIDLHPDNVVKLESCFSEMGFDTSTIPDTVKEGEQNISIKISPLMTLELITRFNPNKTFSQAYDAANEAEFSEGKNSITYKVLSYDDLKVSKVKAGRPKDLLDIMELERIKTA